jgi:hypothetical protein
MSDHALVDNSSSSHNVGLPKSDDPPERGFYKPQCLRANWPTPIPSPASPAMNPTHPSR